MPFVWATNVGVGDDIDAADRNETKTHISTLYTTLGKNWPGTPRFPGCVGAGYDMALPCAVVWDIAVGDPIYQDPGTHPVSELQEARDKLDWIDDNKCAAENAVADNPENAFANPTTQAGDQLATQAGDQLATQAGNQLATQAGDQLATQAGDQLATQAGDQLATEFQDQMGNVAHCPLENSTNDGDFTADCYNEDTGDDAPAYTGYYGDLGANKAIDEAVNYSVDNFEDYGTVEHSDRQSVQSDDDTPYNVVVNIGVFLGVHSPDYAIDNTHYCSSEFATVKTHVDYDDIT